MNAAERIALLREVEFLKVLDDAGLEELAGSTVLRHYPARQVIISELEFGADVFVIARGEAEILVRPQSGHECTLRRVGPCTAFGEMASITGELRSATVRALTPLDVLVISDRLFDTLRVRHPQVALVLARALAQQLRDSERLLAELLRDAALSVSSAGQQPRPVALRFLWRELVINHQKDLAFLTLVSFVVTLVLVRLSVFLSFELDFAPREVLRAAYMSGFALVMLSACSSLFTFRPGWRRAICMAFGAGSALILNELGVTLAFDIFYKDIFTPDPSVPFDIERLYRRTEPVRAIVIGIAVLVQAVYLRSFYTRIAGALRLRLRRWLKL